MGLPPVGGVGVGKRKRAVEAKVVTRYDKKKELLKKEQEEKKKKEEDDRLLKEKEDRKFR